MGISRRIGVLLALVVFLATAAPAETVRWHLSFEYGRSMAKRTNRLMMVELYGVGVASTHRFALETYPDPRVVKASARFVPVRLDAGREGAEIVRRYNVRVTSTILFLTADGRLVHRVVGFCDPRTMILEMGKAEGAVRDRDTFTARLAKNPKDWEAAARMSAIYAYELNIEKSEQMLAQAEKLRRAKDSFLFPEAYNAVGDFYQVTRRFSKAISYFRKAAAAGKRVDDVAYAQISIGTCYLALREFDKMGPELHKVVSLPGVSLEDRAIAKQLLQYTYRSNGGFVKGRK